MAMFIPRLNSKNKKAVEDLWQGTKEFTELLTSSDETRKKEICINAVKKGCFDILYFVPLEMRKEVLLATGVDFEDSDRCKNHSGETKTEEKILNNLEGYVEIPRDSSGEEKE